MYSNTSGDKMSKPWEKSNKEDSMPTEHAAVQLALIAAPIAAAMIQKGSTISAVAPSAVEIAFGIFSKSLETITASLKRAEQGKL